MRFGFIGAGTVAQTIARHLLPFGHQVVLSNSRGKESLGDVVEALGPGARAGTPQEAADQDVAVLAVNWGQVDAALTSVADWSGRVLVDATNRLDGDPPRVGDVSGRTSSELVADKAPRTRVLKAFNNVPMAWISDFSKDKPRTVLFLSGDDAAAKAPLRAVLEEVGFGCIDLGLLSAGGRLQQVGGALGGVRLTMGEKLTL